MGTAKRSQARDLVLQALYAAEVGKGDGQDVFTEIVVGAKLDSNALEFARPLFDKVVEEREWSDKMISKLALNWKLERIAIVDQIVLRMAMTEMKVMPDTPVKVVLNEAIELAKRYSTAESSKFVNGILDSFVKNHVEGAEA